MPRLISIRQTVDRFPIGRCRALVRENMWYIFWGNRRCGLTLSPKPLNPKSHTPNPAEPTFTALAKVAVANGYPDKAFAVVKGELTLNPKP